MSSSSNESHYSRVLRRKQTLNFCSTPLQGAQLYTPSSISVSNVETDSPSSATVRPPLSNQETKANDSRKIQGKKRQKRETKLRRKRRFAAVFTSDSEWETESELVQEEPSSSKSNQQAASASEYSPVLFKDTYGSPECVRRVLYLEKDYGLESPLFQLHRRGAESPEKIIPREEILPLEDSLKLRTRVHDDEEDTEEELILKRTSIIRTYQSHNQVKRFNIDMKVEKEMLKHEWLDRPISYPKATANLLWDNFVKDNYEKIKEYLVPE